MSKRLLKTILVVMCLFLTSISTVFAGSMDDLLYNSVSRNDINMAKVALANGANINYTFRDKTPLGAAVFNQYPEMVRFLLTNGADPKVSYLTMHGDKVPLLVIATFKGNLPIIYQLVDAGADVNVLTDYGSTPLMEAVSNPPKIQATKYLISKQADVNKAQYNSQVTALMIVAKYENGWGRDNPQEKLILAKLLLNAGADPAMRDAQGKTALQYAIDSGFNEMINLLLPISPK